MPGDPFQCSASWSSTLWLKRGPALAFLRLTHRRKGSHLTLHFRLPGMRCDEVWGVSGLLRAMIHQRHHRTARVPRSISPWRICRGNLWRWGERLMRSVRCPSRISTPRPRVQELTPRGLNSTIGARCSPAYWSHKGSAAIPMSGGISALAISFGPGELVTTRLFMDAVILRVECFWSLTSGRLNVE